ncbi:MAG: TIGR02757 family protein, partial [Thermoanaerobaculia bacterium]|nr:TIGR02757 family protein [Thermoanaerobaculia bacterium]
MSNLSARGRLLAERLEALYRTYGPETCATDPIRFPRSYTAPEDQEVVAWVSSAFAYGRVETILANVSGLLSTLGSRPARALEAIPDFGRFGREQLESFRHRFHGGGDAAALLFVIARAREESGSLRGFFEREIRPEDPDVGGLISRVTQKILALDFRPVIGGARRTLAGDSPVRFFFPDPAGGSACKRWNLFLRWMVRKDALDLGLWPGIRTDRLVIPTDTHIHLISRRLGLTRRRSADWKTAREITARLKRFDPTDPVRYDYALCRIGIHQICRSELRLSRCAECLARAACPVGRRRPGGPGDHEPATRGRPPA